MCHAYPGVALCRITHAGVVRSGKDKESVADSERVLATKDHSVPLRMYTVGLQRIKPAYFHRR